MANHEKRREPKVTQLVENPLAPDTQRDPVEERLIARDKLATESPLRNGAVPIPTETKPKTRALLWSVKVRDGDLVVGASPTSEVNPMDGKGWDVVVCGPSVLIVPPAVNVPAHSAIRGSNNAGTSGYADMREAHGLPEPKAMRVAHELPRQSCVIRWLVPSDATAEQLGEMVFGGGFGKAQSCPDGAVLELRRARTAKAAAAVKKPAPVAKAKAVEPDEEDDGFIGSGPAEGPE